MGDTFNTVKEDSDKEWRFTRYSLATEYPINATCYSTFRMLFQMKRSTRGELALITFDQWNRYSSTSAIAPPFNLVVTPLKAIMRQIRKPAYVTRLIFSFSLLLFWFFLTSCSKSKKNVPTVHVRRLKSLSRKFVEEILEDEKEMKKRNLDGIADSLKSHIKKLSIH